MTMQDALEELLELRRQSHAAQETAAHARSAYEQATDQAAMMLREFLDHEDAESFVVGGIVITLRSVHDPRVKSNPFGFSRLHKNNEIII